MRRSAIRRQLSHLCRAGLPGLCLSLTNFLVSFSTPDLSWDPSLGTHTPLSQDGSWSEGFWEEQDSLWLVLSPDLCPLGAFLLMCSVSCPQKGGNGAPFNPLLEQGFAPLCPCRDHYLDYCHDCYLKVFTRDKHWLLTLFLLLFPFQRANRRLLVNALTGAHLSLVSRNASSIKYLIWRPLLRAPWNTNRRPVLNV